MKGGPATRVPTPPGTASLLREEHSPAYAGSNRCFRRHVNLLHQTKAGRML